MTQGGSGQARAERKQNVKASVLVYPDRTLEAGGEHEPEVYSLADNSSFIIGSDRTCRIRLDSDKVSEKHSMLRMVDGAVVVSDWYSDAGTLINRTPITEPTEIGMMDQLEIGPYRIRIVVHAAHEKRATIEDFPEFQGETIDRIEIESSQPTTAEPDETVISPDETAISPDQTAISIVETTMLESSKLADEEPSQPSLREQLEAARQEIGQLEKELEYQHSIQDVAGDDELGGNFGDDFGDDEKEILREEVSHLQTELAQRDQELADLAEAGSVGSGVEQAITEPAETAKLVERLEELLDELQSTDQRVLGLEDSLRASDEAYQAELENHRQIEEWITELEKRVVARDQEWQAREEQLRIQLEAAKKQRPARVPRPMSASHQKNPESEETIRELEAQLAEFEKGKVDLLKQFEESREEVERLNLVMARVGTSETEINQIDHLKHQLREKELILSEKAAEMGRQRAELTKMRDELDTLANEFRPAELDTSNGLKLREFRNHLREIHEQDKKSKQDRSLATRISRLWNRLDGK